MAGRFVIVSMGRTGSTLLTGLLNSHREIECQGEIISPHGKFSQFKDIRRKEFLRRYAYDTHKPIKGFKMPFDWAIQEAGVFEDLKELGYCAIKLVRANPLDHFVSAKLADLNIDYSSQSSYANQAITVSPWEFMQFLGYASAANMCLDAMIAGMPKIDVGYENLLMTKLQSKILNFLGAEPHELKAQTVRSRTKPIEEVIKNYHALSVFFRDSPYAPLWPNLDPLRPNLENNATA